MYTPQQRTMLETTLYNLTYDMDCIGCESEIHDAISRLSDAELESVINDYLANM